MMERGSNAGPSPTDYLSYYWLCLQTSIARIRNIPRYFPAAVFCPVEEPGLSNFHSIYRAVSYIHEWSSFIILQLTV